ncbi:MAG: glycosyltransferase family 39 protein [Opitutaceae bacterium]|nr:glycosyltransferase family 39 protein [Opitutaceae bacterium]
MSEWAQGWALLPLVGWAGAVAALRARGAEGWDAAARAAVLAAATAWGLSNLLGWFELLGSAGLRIGWALLAAAAWGWAWREGASRDQCRWARWEKWEWAVAVCCAVPVGLAAVAAVVASPATVDVLNYHQPRQWMWLQQASLEHFPTINDRMLMMPPLAEVIGLQFLALTGDDRWANLPQWAAYLGCAGLGFAAVRKLGGGRAAGWATAWLILTLPMAYHEASNAKNDLLGAFWTLVVLHEVLRARRGAADWRAGWWAGAAVGLALLNKSTAFLFLPPLLAAGVVAWWLGSGRRAALRTAAVAAGAVVLLTAPFFLRNVAWYGSPLGVHRAEEGGELANTVRAPWVPVSNALRLATLHAAGPSPAWNAWLETRVRELHAWADWDVDDRRTTLWVTNYRVAYSPGEETEAGAGVHLVLIVAAVGAALATGRKREAWWLAGALVWGALVFCWVLKWQPWAARLQLPGFVLGCVCVGAVLPARAWRWWLGCALGAGLLAWWPSRESRLRPLWTSPTIFEVSRETNRRRVFPALMGRDERVAALVRESGVTDIVLLSVHDSVYPLMRQLGLENPQVRINRNGERAPEAILVCEHFKPLETGRVWADGTRYRLVGDGPGDCLYLREDIARRLGWMLRLPPFAGWSHQSGFGIEITGEWSDTVPQQVFRRIKTSPARIFFSAASAGHALLELEAERSAPGRLAADLSLNGERVREVELAEHEGSRRISLRVPVKAGENELTLAVAPEHADALVFRVLRIYEEDAITAP